MAWLTEHFEAYSESKTSHSAYVLSIKDLLRSSNIANLKHSVGCDPLSTDFIATALALNNYNMRYTEDVTRTTRSAAFYRHFLDDGCKQHYTNAPAENKTIVDLVFVNVNYNITEFFDTEPRVFTDFENLNTIELYLKSTMRHKIKVYRRNTTYTYNNNESRNAIQLFIASNKPINQLEQDAAPDFTIYKKLIAALPLMLDLAEEHPLTPIFKNIVNCANNKTFIDTIEDYFKTLDIDVQLIEEKLNRVFKTMVEAEKLQLIKDLQTKRQDIVDKEKLLREAYNDLHNIELKQLVDTDIDCAGIKQLFKNKTILDLQVDADQFNITLQSVVNNYNKDAAKAYLRNNTKGCSQVIKDVFEELFIKERMHLVFTENIRLSTTGVHYRFGGAVPQCMANTHHKFYNCWGSYDSVLSKLLSKRDYLMLFINMKQAVGSLNMLDYVVMSKFIAELVGVFSNEHYKICYIDDPNNCLSLKEALNILKERDATNETDTDQQ